MNNGRNGYIKFALLILLIVILGYFMGVNHDVIQEIISLLIK